MTQLVKNILEKTKDAYSYERYSEKGWIAIIKYFLKNNISEENIVKYMLSKHMRWAGDCSEEFEYGTLNLTVIKTYFEKYPKSSIFNAKLN